jgi:hypothetical protein
MRGIKKHRKIGEAHQGTIRNDDRHGQEQTQMPSPKAIPETRPKESRTSRRSPRTRIKIPEIEPSDPDFTHRR